jgi:tricorn protease
MAYQGSFSDDGSHIAYVPLPGAFQVWKRYRGGEASPVWIADLSDSSVVKVPREDSNDFNPMWIGREVYFLSDRNGTVSLFSYDTESKQVTEVLANEGMDIKSASANTDGIVYEQFGSLHFYDITSKQTRAIDIQLAGDIAAVRPRFEEAAENISTARLSPSGARAVFEARGEILTVPAEKGDIRNLTETSGAADRDPSWSPDGEWIAYFSDRSGEYALYLTEQSGLGETKRIDLGLPPSFFYTPTWSPDSKKIAYTDKRLNIWYVDIESKERVKVDTTTYDSPFHTFDPVWSPDGRWLGYTKELRSHLHAVFLHDLETGKTFQVSDGMSDARYPAFDKNGKYLYFTASTDAGPTAGWLDMSSVNRPVSRSVYVVVLNQEDPSPLAPESDEEKIANDSEKASPEGESEDDENEAVAVTVDIEGIDQRIRRKRSCRRDGRHRRYRPADSSLAYPCEELLGTSCRERRGFLSAGSSSGNRRWTFSRRRAPLRARRARDGTGPRGHRRLRGFGERREDALPQGRTVDHHRHGYGARARERSARPHEDDGSRRPSNRVESDVPRGMADRT